MFSHVMIGVSDIEASKQFYDAVLGTLGLGPGVDNKGRYFYVGPAGVFAITVPIDGEPADVVATVRANNAFLQASKMPKLFVNAKPGAILQGSLADHCRAWPNISEVTVAGNHFVQEDSPDEIGTALAEWISGL